MRIGLVLPAVPGYSETFFSNKIKGLEANGYTVILFVNSCNRKTKTSTKTKVAPKLSGNMVRIGMISFYRLSYSLIFHFKVSRRLFILDRDDGINFIQRIKNIIINNHIFSEPVDWLHFGFGTMVLNRENVAKAIGAKMAVSFRGFDIGIYPVKHPGCYKRLWEKVDKIHVISNDISELVYKQGFNNQVPIIKITPAIDIRFFKNNHKTEYNKIPHFITVARLHWKKGLDYTLEALALLKEENIPFHYTIIGDGPQEEYLKFGTHQLGLNDYVTFTGKLSHELVKKKLEQADIYLQYSIQEGFCNSVLEAQAIGLLCVVSDAEGLSENVLHNKTGWVVPLRQPKLLLEKIRNIINLPQTEKDTISQNAKERVKLEFNIKKQQKEFVGFYENN
ncbi:glycosyltransferase family 4 protein [Confluentibacter flavum]|uniref:Glycosyltransferase n=1 Tax=Confluentibacter flavum TaxID=1909700 RepID=A0A2N3HP39_9FLAO|nr:glycosyltransferase family 4 protein [Confluentibacter flavum]PKQ46739.1 glycosyltransferase [Confluentibacter flavum]